MIGEVSTSSPSEKLGDPKIFPVILPGTFLRQTTKDGYLKEGLS